MEVLFYLFLGTPLWMWGLFLCLVLGLLAFDLGVLNRGPKEIGVRESLTLSAFYIVLGLGFACFVWWQMGAQSAAEYLTAFGVEKSLALDNVFVIALIFPYVAVPRAYQHRVLLWGIIGVIVLRGIMIGVGAALVQNYHWVLYIFAAFLVFTGIRMLMIGDHTPDLKNNALLKFLRRRLRVTDDLHGNAFLVKKEGPVRGETGHLDDAVVPVSHPDRSSGLGLCG